MLMYKMETKCEFVEEEVKHVDFNREFNIFLSTLEQVIELYFAKSIAIDRIPKELTALEKFDSCYQGLYKDRLCGALNNIYSVHQKLYYRIRDQIIGALDDDSWLNSEIKLFLGKGNLKLEKQNMCIYVGEIYRYAINIQKNAKESNLGVKSKQHVYPQLILYHFIKLFYILMKDDRDYLYPVLSKLETILMINVSDRVPAPIGAASNGLPALLSKFAPMAAQFGLKDPEGKPFTSESLTKACKNIMDTKLVSNVMESVKDITAGKKDIASAVQEGMAHLQKPESLDEIQKIQSSFLSGDKTINSDEITKNLEKAQKAFSSFQPAFEKLSCSMNDPEKMGNILNEGVKMLNQGSFDGDKLTELTGITSDQFMETMNSINGNSITSNPVVYDD